MHFLCSCCSCFAIGLRWCLALSKFISYQCCSFSTAHEMPMAPYQFSSLFFFFLFLSHDNWGDFQQTRYFFINLEVSDLTQLPKTKSLFCFAPAVIALDLFSSSHNRGFENSPYLKYLHSVQSFVSGWSLLGPICFWTYSFHPIAFSILWVFVLLAPPSRALFSCGDLLVLSSCSWLLCWWGSLSRSPKCLCDLGFGNMTFALPIFLEGTFFHS